MGRKSGDKGKYHRQRRKKLAKRVKMRALRKELTEAAKTKPSRAADATTG
jgi:hypothetical protein